MKITLNHGSGGTQMHQLIKERVIDRLSNGILERMDDSAILENQNNKKISMTTDSYVVSPLFFDGGDIGRLCICGTVNDLTTSGAKPYALSLAFILEEGTDISLIEKVVDSIVETANEAGVNIVTGDTKVVEKGKGDGLYINTCGIGFIDNETNISTYNAKNGNKVLITGPIGNHEVAMMKARKMIDFDVDVKSDAAPLNKPIEKLLNISPQGINVIKDPTRGGLASALKEISEHSNCTIEIDEELLPIDKNVQAVCDLIGFDPLYLANEGKFVIVCDDNRTQDIINCFPEAKIIGEVKPGEDLLLKTSSGGVRRVGMLETMQLPRIC